ncbi:cytochrome b/b6 domain-containing protein [Paraburkholderia sp. MMS20-SJTN17]|uniref:Cytochrome b/b6 domain-containing protein n=1 Tax=Paraburkholderia translucens TaxID=2886945 RepID=A0ABS8KB19_9BURK|nr:cytochrome b/b6 domain-containing protein [Paraburkholderia sp. MMS20-SJTN17]MCC8401654.1 cytochrome b/b6 domain-containing protein [Paraburkholderia sp. MMS20-SJTN17]
MNDTWVSRADNDAHAPGTVRILVWDAPVRVFHWLMVASFAGAWLTAESERWRLLHATLGYTMVGLVAFRIVWGVMGTRYARFSAFVRSPRAVLRYMASLLKGRPERHVGHNPAGAIAIIAMLLMTWAVGVTGWAAYNSTGGEWLGELHGGLANAMLALIVIHVVAVLASSLLHRENLIGAMVTGYKSGRANESIRTARWGFAALVMAAAIAWWWTQWQAAPQASAPNPSAASAAHLRTDGDGDGD